jgi:hypothetical protein
LEFQKREKERLRHEQELLEFQKREKERLEREAEHKRRKSADDQVDNCQTDKQRGEPDQYYHHGSEEREKKERRKQKEKVEREKTQLQADEQREQVTLLYNFLRVNRNKLECLSVASISSICEYGVKHLSEAPFSYSTLG